MKAYADRLLGDELYLSLTMEALSGQVFELHSLGNGDLM